MATLEEKIKAQVEALLKPTLDSIGDAIRYHTGNTKLIPFTTMPDVIRYQLQKAGSEGEGDVVVGINGVYEEEDTIRINFAGVSEGVANALLQYSFAKATIDETINSRVEFTTNNSNSTIVFKGTNADIDLTNALGNISITIDEDLPPNVTATGLDPNVILKGNKVLGVEGKSEAITPSGTLAITIESNVENLIRDVREYAEVSIAVNVSDTLLSQEKVAVPTTELQRITADGGYYLTAVLVQPVTASIDPNIKSEYIRDGVTILGEVGTYEGSVQIYGDGTTLEPEAMITSVYFNDQINKREFCEILDAIGLAQQGEYYVVCNSSETQFVKVVRDYEDATNTRKGYRVYIADSGTEVQVFEYYYWLDSEGNVTYDTGAGLSIVKYNFKSSFLGISGKADDTANFQVGHKNDKIYNAISKTDFVISQELKSKSVIPSELKQTYDVPTGEVWYKVIVEAISPDNISYKENLVTYPSLSPDIIKHDVEVLGLVGTYYGDNLSSEIPVITENGRHDVARYEYVDVNVPMGYTGVTATGSTLTISNDEGHFDTIVVSKGEDEESLDRVTFSVNGTGVIFDNQVNNSTIGVNGSENILSIIDSDGLTGSIQADSATLDLVLVDSELNLSYCSDDIIITDTFVNTHKYIVNNLKPENIKNGVTILGIEGTYGGDAPSGTLTITTNGNYNVASYADVIVNVAGGLDSTISVSTNNYGYRTYDIALTTYSTYNIEARYATFNLGVYNGTINLEDCIGTGGVIYVNYSENDEVQFQYNSDNTIKVIATNLSEGNIAEGVTILGVTGTHKGAEVSGTMDITENGTHYIAGYEYVEVQVPDNGITGVTSTGASGTMTIDHSKTVEDRYTIKEGSPDVTITFTSGANVSFPQNNANANVSLGGKGGTIDIGSKCAGTYTVNIGGRTMVVEFSSTGVLSQITLDGVIV